MPGLSRMSRTRCTQCCKCDMKFEIRVVNYYTLKNIFIYFMTTHCTPSQLRVSSNASAIASQIWHQVAAVERNL